MRSVVCVCVCMCVSGEACHDVVMKMMRIRKRVLMRTVLCVCFRGACHDVVMMMKMMRIREDDEDKEEGVDEDCAVCFRGACHGRSEVGGCVVVTAATLGQLGLGQR